MNAWCTWSYTIIVIDLTYLANHSTCKVRLVPIYQAPQLICHLSWTITNGNLCCRLRLTASSTIITMIFQTKCYDRRGIFCVQGYDVPYILWATDAARLYWSSVKYSELASGIAYWPHIYSLVLYSRLTYQLVCIQRYDYQEAGHKFKFEAPMGLYVAHIIILFYHRHYAYSLDIL